MASDVTASMTTQAGLSHPGGEQTHDDGHHGVLQHQFDDLEQQRECFTLGMWLFLATEVMMFGGLFFTYSLYRSMFDGAFHEGSKLLNHPLGTANTFVLLASSLTMAMAVHSAVEKKRNAMLGWLAITWLFGASFLGIKAVEWTIDYQEGLIPGVNWTFFTNPHFAERAHHLLEHGATTPDQVKMYFVVYFCMTGLHALHMIIGLGVVAAFMLLGARGKFTNGNDQPVEILGLYWHLVDIIWVFLFPLLYLIGGLQLGGHH